MSSKTSGEQPSDGQLIERYRPLGLKAVVAAAMQIKSKPAADGLPSRTMSAKRPA